jgi:uncharacterized protein YbjT (DUF2867 family)
MRILVTGATGQVGRHLVEELHQGGHEVRALTRDPARAALPDGVHPVQGDLTKVEAVHLITFGGDDSADLSNGADLVELAERKGVSPRAA